MKVYTDKIPANDLPAIAAAAFPKGSAVYVNRATEIGTRKRAYGYNITLAAKRSSKKATWIEWGDYMLELFKVDDALLIVAGSGNYDGAHDFVHKTHVAASRQPEPELAERAADRWAEELFWLHQETTARADTPNDVDPALAQKESALRHRGLDPESMTDEEIDAAFKTSTDVRS